MIKTILLTSLGFSVGIAFVSGWLHLISDRRAIEKFFYVTARWGYAVSFGLLLEALTKAPIVEGSWRAWLFIISCIAVAIGFAGVAIEDRKKHRRV